MADPRSRLAATAACLLPLVLLGPAVAARALAYGEERVGAYANPLDVLLADPFVLLDRGTYYLYAVSPPGYRPSSSDTWEIRLGAGDARIRAGFRAAPSLKAAFSPAFADNGRSKSPNAMPSGLLVLWTVFLVVGGVLSAVGLSTLANIRHPG